MRQPDGPRVWTTGIKLMGNLLPMLTMVPPAIVGWQVRDPEAPWMPPALLWYAASPVIGWLAVNFLGLYGNSRLRSSIGRRLDRERAPVVERRWFVGIARSGYSNILDPHEDIGFLVLREDALEFYGDSLRLTIPKEQVVSVGRAANPHTWIGLGGWVDLTLSGEENPKLRIESRDSDILWVNKRGTRAIRAAIAEWLFPSTGETNEERPRDEPGT